MVCTGCGAEANASCNCGLAYVPASQRAAEAIKNNPEKSNRAIAAELGVSDMTVGRARESLGATYVAPDRLGRDGKIYTFSKPEEVLEAAKVIRAERLDEKRAEKIAAIEQIAANNAAIPVDARKYSVIYADPPWSFEVWSGAGKDRAAENHYPTMQQEEIEALPVSRFAADNCALFMWAVMPQLAEALRVIAAWGFEYKTCAFVWVKQTQDEQRLATGMGYWTRANAEICLLATKGSPPRLNADVHQVVMSPRLEHSRKPDEIAARIERLIPGPYIELFSRRKREGWDAWGNQA